MSHLVNQKLHNTQTNKDAYGQKKTSSLMTIAEVIDYLNVSKAYFYKNLIERIPSLFLDEEKKVRRYRMSAVDAWLDQQSII